MALPDLDLNRLIGRDRELAMLSDFLHMGVTDGGALLLSGEPGIGKTALLDAAGDLAPSQGLRVIRSEAVEYETDVSFAGLHQLAYPLLNDLDRLPPTSRAALEATLGVGAGPAPERLAVLNASLALFRAVAAETPLLIVVDDLHLLDRATRAVIGFIGRRLAGCRIGLLGATCPETGGFIERAGLSELEIAPLTDADAMQLLARRFAHLPARVLREITRDAQGNPLALLEFAASAGGPDNSPGHAPRGSGRSRDVRTLFGTRIGRLPEPTRDMLLLAALEGTGSLTAVATASGGGLGDLGAAERDNLVIVDDPAGQMRFRHPLIKSAVLQRSTHEQRRTAHQRLAEVFADQAERRGYHLAHGTAAPDDGVADAIEVGARGTLQRGDVVGAVTRLMRAADLSPRRADRSRRLAEAAYISAYAAGQLKSSSQLLRHLQSDDPGLDRSLPVAAACGYLLLNSDGDIATAHRVLTVALESVVAEPDRNPEGLFQALSTLLQICHYAGRADYWRHFGHTVAVLSDAAPRGVQILAEILADPASVSDRTLCELDVRVERLPDTMDADVIVRTALTGFYLDRLPGCRDALSRVIDDARDGGAVGAGIVAVLMRTFDDLYAGRWEAAQEGATEATDLCRQRGYRLYEWSGHYATALVAAHRGDRLTCIERCEAMLEWAEPRQLGLLRDRAHHGLALAALGAGDYEAAYTHAVAISPPGALRPHSPEAIRTGLDLVDAAVHLGREENARAHTAAMRDAGLGRISPRLALTTAAATAMVAPDHEAAQRFDEALTLPGIEAWPFEIGRVRLAYGERLRRLRNHRAAAVQLAAARDCFERLGAVTWSQRAAAELRATGERRYGYGAGGTQALTPQELEVAGLAATGQSNREIATRLYLSPRTVSSHLYRAFPKLGITSRAALRDALVNLAAEGPNSAATARGTLSVPPSHPAEVGVRASPPAPRSG